MLKGSFVSEGKRENQSNGYQVNDREESLMVVNLIT